MMSQEDGKVNEIRLNGKKTWKPYVKHDASSVLGKRKVIFGCEVNSGFRRPTGLCAQTDPRKKGRLLYEGLSHSLSTRLTG